MNTYLDDMQIIFNWLRDTCVVGERYKIDHNYSGDVKITFVNDANHPHRDNDDLPAYIMVNCAKGFVSEEKWYYDGQLHREGGPAFIIHGQNSEATYPQNTAHMQAKSAIYGKVCDRANNRFVVYDREIKWFNRHKNHRVDGPANIRQEVVNGYLALSYQEWLINDQFHREDGPAVIRYANTTTKSRNNTSPMLVSWPVHMEYYKNGMFHREHGPAIVDYGTTYSPLRSTFSRKWVQEGKSHRMDGPAEIKHFKLNDEFYLNSYWYKHGQSHCESGPAATTYSIYGNECRIKRQQIYQINGRRHRTDGPAHITTYYNPDGKVTRVKREYFLDGSAVDITEQLAAQADTRTQLHLSQHMDVSLTL